MEISPRELRDVEIRQSLRGYNPDEVNDLLERAAATIQADVERIQQLTERLANAQTEAGRTRETEDVLHRTLLLAQRAADEAVAEATGKSRQMLDDAELSARRLVADAEADARRKGEAERQRLEGEILELAGRRDSLLADVEALTRFEAEYRERMTRALEADLFALKSRPTTAPGTRPETSEVELPSDDEVATSTPSAPSAAPAPVAPVVAVPAAAAVVEPEPEPEPAAAAAPAPAPEAPPAPAPADAPANSTEAAAPSAAMATHEVDVRSLFENSQQVPVAEAPAPAAAAAAVSEAPRGEAPQPLDLLSNDGADADVLDDDAFFATLRDAVHDEAPLGPRDENDATGDHAFFDQDAERGGFRDVFRRRR